MLNQFSRMAMGRGNNILTSCQPMHSGSSRMRELPAGVFTFSEKKKKNARYDGKVSLPSSFTAWSHCQISQVQYCIPEKLNTTVHFPTSTFCL